MKKQEGSYDCRIYAIAYATALAYGQDPGENEDSLEKLSVGKKANRISTQSHFSFGSL